MTDADRHTDIAVDDLKAGIARGRRNSFLINMLGVGIAVAAVVIAGYYSLGEVGEAERQVAVVAEARDEAKLAAEEANRKFAEAGIAAGAAKAEVTRVSSQLQLAESEVASLSAQIAQAQSGDGERVAVLEAELAKAEESRATLAQQSDQLQGEAQALAARLDEAQAVAAEAETQRNQMATTIVALQSNVENVRGKLDTVVAERDNLNRRAVALRSTAASRLQSLETVRGRLGQVERQNTSLNQRLATLSARAGTAAERVRALERQIAGLKRENQRLAALLANRDPGGNRCAWAIQDKIAWDYRGSKRWSDASIKRLCGRQTRSTEPARCFQKVMFGSINSGRGIQWKWQDAVDLCEGASNASARIDCFRRALPRLRSQRAAIAACDERSARTR